ncbi:MAG: IS1 family transposase [Cyclobacteriaceae bacterium]|nr:IS1 family transposase [Cyclobacteriaceae bacterium]
MVQLLIEGTGIRGISRVLRISLPTVIERIKRITKAIQKPYSFLRNRIYEIDELWTYIGKKTNEVWIMYMIDRHTKSVIDFRVGSRTKENIQTLTGQVLYMHPKRICTDGLNIYRSLVPGEVHHTGQLSARHIERKNLSMRTHLKRLNRKTICFSRSKEMLEACLRIYFWGQPNLIKI